MKLFQQQNTKLDTDLGKTIKLVFNNFNLPFLLIEKK